MKTRQITAFFGVIGSGKTYNANNLVEFRGYKRVSFADSLRDVAFTSLNINKDDINYRDFKSQEIYNGITFRNYLQLLGDSVRKYDPNYFTKATINTIDELGGNICIDDLRFGNEFKMLYDYCRGHNYNLTIYYCNFNSDCKDENSKHASEKMAQYFLNRKHLEIIDNREMLTYYYNVERQMTLKQGIAKVLDKYKDSKFLKKVM